MLADVHPSNLQPGMMVDGWRIVRSLGRGGYAVVYEVEKEGQRFALKLACHTERSLDPKQVHARAEREVACLQQLKHPHIIRMRAHGRWPDPSSGLLYIVMDFVDGHTLVRWAQQTAPTLHDYAVLFLKLFDALDYMHRHQVFHRDLSLNNIMVNREGEPVIIDFGVADYATADHLTDGPVPPGTPRNRSPEAERFWEENRHKPGARYTFTAADDIFALGANLYDLLTEPLLAPGSPRPVLGHPVLVPHSPWKISGGRISAEMSAYVMKLIHPDLEVRYSAAKDAKRPVEQFAQYEDSDWRDRPAHPVATLLPPEPAEAAPLAVEARQVEGPPVPLPVQPPPVQEPPAQPVEGAAAQSLPPPPAQEPPAPPVEAAAQSLPPPPAQEPPAPPAEAAAQSLPPPPAQEPPAPPAEAAARSLPRPVWQRPVFAGPLALAVLAGLVTPFLLHGSVRHEPPSGAEHTPVAQPPASRTLAEKPTSRPEQLASPLPTQQEASPSVKQSDTTPTRTHGLPRKQPVLSKAQRCALLVATVEWHAAGCAGVQQLPQPGEACPEGSAQAMRKELGWALGSNVAPYIYLDVTKPLEPTAVFKDGPVTGALVEPFKRTPEGLRLEGHLWTTGDRIYGRYVRAHLPGGRTVPICLEIEEDERFLGIPKEKGSRPGHTIGSTEAQTRAVERWR